MKARLARLANRLHESYWFVPTLMAAAALLLALGLVWLDSHHATDWMERVAWLHAARPQGARSLLSSIGGSMIGVAGTTFSITIAAVVYASGQYGPRLLSNFMSDRGNQVTLGTFIATFLYSLVVVRTIRSPGEAAGEAAFVPQLAVLVGVLLVFCSIAVLIYFIHHVPSRLHINSVIERIGSRLLEEIGRRFPASGNQPTGSVPAITPIGAGRPVRATDTGYIQLIDEGQLIELACGSNAVFGLHYQPGDFVHRGTVLLEAWPGGILGDDALCILREAYTIGAKRTALQDLRFLIDELVEIAARALSPGVNDPFTAGSCLDWLGAALADLAGRELPSRGRTDPDGVLRVIALPMTFAGFVEDGLGALAQYASQDMIAGRRFLAVLGDVASHCQASERLDILRHQAEQFRILVEDALTGANRAAVVNIADRLLQALETPDHQRRLTGREWLIDAV